MADQPEMTLCLLKPDAIEGGHMDPIVEAIEKLGFVILQQDMRMMTYTTARQFYREHEKKDYFEELVQFICSGPVLALILTKPGDPIADPRVMMGPTNSERARADDPDSLRAEYGTDGMRNAVHGSADAEAAAHEIHTLFPLTMVKGETRTAEPSTEELVEVISAGMAELCRVKPEEPVSWLAEWMVANRNPADRNKKRLGALLS